MPRRKQPALTVWHAPSILTIGLEGERVCAGVRVGHRRTVPATWRDEVRRLMTHYGVTWRQSETNPGVTFVKIAPNTDRVVYRSIFKDA